VASVLQIIVAVAATPISWPLCLALFYPSLAVLVRRLHDVNRSGWWAASLPVLSFMLLFMYALTRVMLGDQTGTQILIAAGLGLLAMIVLGTTLLVWTCRRVRLRRTASDCLPKPPRTEATIVQAIDIFWT
jgi:uncharacterized membrane protein YhaH (DUF805 family)